MASTPEVVDYFRLPEDAEFSQGMEFCTHSDFKEKFEDYCRRTGQVFFCRTFTSVMRANERVASSRPKFNIELAVSSATYLCVHASAHKSRSTGKRPNTKSQRKHCPAKMLLSADRYKGDKSGSQQVLRITELSVCHNHDVSPTDYDFYARNRSRLTDQQRVFVSRALNLKINSATVKECLQQLGKEVKYQDIRNMRNRARRPIKSERNEALNLINDIMKFKGTDADIEESKSEELLKTQLYQMSPQSQSKPPQKINISAALGKPVNNERIRKSPLNPASTSSNNSTLSSQPIEIESDSPPAKKPREIHIDTDVSEDESAVLSKPFIQPTIDPPDQKSMKPTVTQLFSSVHNSVLDANVPQKPKRILVVPNHQQSVMSNLSSLWKAGRLCDAFISNGAVNLKVHKMILAAVSPKVLDVFCNTPRHKLPHVTFPSSVSKEGLLAFAEYMYNGVLDLNPDLLSQMMTIAKQLDMTDFEQLCTNQLKSANTLPAILETMLNELCSSSRLFKQSAAQSNETSVTERIPALNRTSGKNVDRVDSLNKISSTVNNCNKTVSNVSSEGRTRTDDTLMEVTNNNLAAPSIGDHICDINVNNRPQVKIENVESDEQHYGKEVISSNIDYSTSANITSNFTHLPHTDLSQPSSSTSISSSHTNNTTLKKHLPVDQIWTQNNKEKGNLVGNVKPADPYPIGLFTSNWANVPIHTQDIKKENTVE